MPPLLTAKIVKHINLADNLLLTADKKTVKLADFGLAREESVTEMMTAETGTYRWMAPEVCSNFSFVIIVFSVLFSYCRSLVWDGA